MGIPTFAALLGILISVLLYKGLSAKMSCIDNALSMVGRMGSLEARMLSLENTINSSFDLVMAKLASIDAHLRVRSIAASGGDPAKFAGHSLRAGLATAAALGGSSERSIMNQTGHRSLATLRRYIREGGLFQENAVAKIGL
jgi:hypothetical protein